MVATQPFLYEYSVQSTASKFMVFYLSIVPAWKLQHHYLLYGFCYVYALYSMKSDHLAHTVHESPIGYVHTFYNDLEALWVFDLILMYH